MAAYLSSFVRSILETMKGWREDDYTRLRELMVEHQIAARGVRDPLTLDAMRAVPRESFVPENLRSHAYLDGPLSIGEGQTISQPFVVAIMVEALEIGPKDRVLDVGTGSGYAAAVISRIAAEVFSVERIPSLAKAAEQRLRDLGYSNIQVRLGDGTLGWPENAPYDAIMVAAGSPEVPRPLKEQLRVGGRIVIPVGSNPRSQILVRVRRVDESEYRHEDLGEVSFVPLIGAAGWSPEEAETRLW